MWKSGSYPRSFFVDLGKYRKLEIPVLFPSRNSVAGLVNQRIMHFNVP